MKKVFILLLIALSLTACGNAVTTSKENKPVASPIPKATAMPIATPTPTLAAAPKATNVPKAAKREVKKSQTKTNTNTASNSQKTEKKVNETPKNQAKDTVKLTIFGEKEMLNTTAIPKEGETVADLLKRVAEEHGIKVKIRGKGIFAYIVSIGDLAEFDKGPESGWTYYVNNEYKLTGAGNVIPKAGDLIEWKYKF